MPALLAPSSNGPAAGLAPTRQREERDVARGDRQKASDVFASTTFLLSGKGTFAEAFPTVEEASVEVVETDMGSPVRTHHYSSRTGMGEFVDCSNRFCY